MQERRKEHRRSSMAWRVRWFTGRSVLAYSATPIYQGGLAFLVGVKSVDRVQKLPWTVSIRTVRV